MSKVAKGFLIGCGGLLLLSMLAVAGAAVWLLSGPESGVKLGNEMDRYAIDYLAKHNLLEPGEEVLAYYDATMSMDGTEAAILSGARVMYHKAGNTTAIRLAEVEDIRHRYESLVGDVIEVQSTAGQVMKIEIAPLNQGETFRNVLMTTWQKAREAAAPGAEAAP